MLPPRVNLNVHVAWHDLERALELPRSTQTLPVQTACPLCHGERLTVFQHSRKVGLWHYCFDCHSSGDLLELASAVLKRGLPQTVAYLHAEGVLPEIPVADVESYVRRVTRPRQRHLQFWQDCQHHLTHTERPANTLRKRLRLIDHANREHLAECGGQFFGVCTTTQWRGFRINKTLAEPIRRKVRKDRVRYWDDMLVIPYFAAPGHVCGFYTIHATQQKDERRFLLLPGSGQECGLAGLPSVLDSDAGTVFALRDPVLMLQLQMRNFTTSLRPLPLVSWQGSPSARTNSTWSLLNGRSLVFWTRQLDAETLLQCQHTDGHLVVLGPEKGGPQQLNHYLRLTSATDLLHRFSRLALPWREAVVRWMRKMPEAYVTRLQDHLSAVGHPHLLQECNPRSRYFSVGKLQIRQTTIFGHTYVEHGDRWYRRQGQREVQVCNGVMRISDIVTRPGGGSEYYGTLVVDGGHYPFAWKQQGSFGGAVRAAAARHGVNLQLTKGLPTIALAEAFHEPRRVRGQDRLGWDGKRFWFRRFTIDETGLNKHSECIFPPHCPGPQVREPRMRDTVVARLNLVNKEMEVFWAITTSLMTSLVAHAAGLQGVQTLITCPKPRLLLDAILSRLGVPRRHVFGASSADSWPHGRRWRHRWPVFVSPGSSGKMDKLPGWLLEQDCPWICAEVTPLQAQTLLTYGRFQWIDCSGEYNPAAIGTFPMEHIVPRFLCKCYRQIRDGGPTGVQERWVWTQAMLWSFLEEHGAPKTSIDRAIRLMRFEGADWTTLAARLYVEDWLTADPVPGRVQVPFGPVGLEVSAEKLQQAVTLAKLSLSERVTVPKLTLVRGSDIASLISPPTPSSSEAKSPPRPGR